MNSARTKHALRRISVAAAALLGCSGLWASGAGTAGGLTLAETPSARASALAETLVAAPDDIAAFGYNPSLLGTLRSGQASFLYQKGLVDDSYAHVMIGRPTARGGFGLSVGYYNAGEIDLHDADGRARTVTAQKDLALTLGLARSAGRFSFGFAAKYLSSEIVEQAKANAYAADFGLSMAATRRLRVGAAVQNIGTQVKYVEEGDDLPRTARIGASFALPRRGYTITIFGDAAYQMIDKVTVPSAGVEIGFGPLALRLGGRGGPDTEISVGTGFLLGGSSTIDYSFGMAQDLDAAHRVSYSFRFGSGAPSDIAARFASKPDQAARKTTQVASAPSTPLVLAPDPSAPRDPVWIAPRKVYIYTVKEGDTLAIIAKEKYGNPKLWAQIYRANKHLLDDPAKVEVGQKLVLP